MQLWFWFVIALAPTVVLAFLLWKSSKVPLSAMETLAMSLSHQMSMNQVLVNLILSKDPMTFQQIQAMTNSPQVANHDVPVNPLDDASMAEALAKHYAASGIDPRHAYVNDDDFDMASELGLNQ